MGNKKKTRKTVPKEFISLFRVHSGRDAPRRDTREVQKSKKHGFRFTSLPDLPLLVMLYKNYCLNMVY